MLSTGASVVTKRTMQDREPDMKHQCRECLGMFDVEELTSDRLCPTCYDGEQQPAIEMAEERARQDYRAAHGYYDNDREPIAEGDHWKFA